MLSSVIESASDHAGRSRFYPLRIRNVEHDTADALIVTFDVPPELRALFQFVQGQHLTLRTQMDGEEVRRSYSICSAVQDATLRVGIKRVPHGVFSTWASKNLKPGATLEALPPVGHFFVPLSPENQKQYVAFAAGSGITPILSLAKTTLIAEPRSTFTLFYGNRSTESIMFREELADLKDSFLGRFHLAHVLTREHQDCELFNGRLTPDKCDLLLKQTGPIGRIDSIFVCGPQEMAVALTDHLKKLGVEESRIKVELFSAAPSISKRTPAAEATAETGLSQISITVDGRQRVFSMPRGEESILDAALRRGIELRYSCKSGVCATCRSKLTEGRVEMDANYALEPDEIRRGFILTCQSYPVTGEVKIDFDQDT